jgi:hypothetical protein
VLPLPPSLPVSFPVVSDNSRAEEVLPGCVPQSSASPVRIPFSFWSGPMQSLGRVGSQSGMLSRLFQVDCWHRTVLGKFQKRQRSFKHREVNLYLVKARSKLSGPHILTDILDPGSSRINLPLEAAWRKYNSSCSSIK